MAKTRSPKYYNQNLQSLEAAAFPLEVKEGTNSLLYNTQVIDFLTNSVNGNTALAWYYWGKLPELRYSTRYISNALSVADLYIAKETGPGQFEKLPETHPAAQLLEDFAGGSVGQATFLDRLGLHLTVAGDSVIIGPKFGTGGEQEPFDQWRVFSTDEVYARNGKTYLKMPGNAQQIQVPDSCLSVRIWRPHPRFWWDADSPVKGSFSVLRELCLLDDNIHSAATSRVAGAGVLGIPDELDLPTGDMEIDGTEVDQFIAFLTEVMSIAIKNPESAAARVPIIIRGPAEYISKIQHFDFSTKFDEMVPSLREGAIRRVALGMDIPPEILLGSSQSTSWSAWQTDESTLRVHLVPLLQLICSSLTVGWLRPMLEELPLSKADKADVSKLVVHFDVSRLRIHQNVSGDAEALYDRLGISQDALLQALGYSPGDEPDKKEVAYQILLGMIKGGNPQMVPYAIESLRENFGITDLPDPKTMVGEAFPRATEQIGPGGQVVAKPGETTGGAAPAPSDTGAATPEPAPAESSAQGQLPGDRSQAKQVSLPPVPKIGDQSNNANGGSLK